MIYSIREFLMNNCNGNFGSSFLGKTQEEFIHRQKIGRADLANITGFDKIEKLRYAIAEEGKEQEFENYTMKRIVLQTHKFIFMPFYILTPKTEGVKIPVIAIAGHGSNGKEGVCGADNTGVGKYKNDYGRQMAQAGYLVFAPDLAGFGERREEKEQSDILKSSCNDINFAAIAAGLSLQAINLNDIAALTDYIFDYENCDPSKLVCMGFSGGGWQTLWAAAMDERIKTALVAGYFHGFRDPLLKNNLCGCNFVPKFWEKWSITDLAALITPRNLYIESGLSDPLHGPSGMENVVPFVNELRQIYRLFDTDNLYHHIFEGSHEYSGYAAEFLKMI
ncbi:MAG: dienelactone hydrolase family protein [Defluviitaleaceae bacterium]|nr:dienelactone hydrolase family protein [Defluviitaleaceae bacterium]